MPVDHKLRLIPAHLDNDQFLSRCTKIRAYDSILKDAWNKLSFIYRGRMSIQMIVHWPKPFLGSNLESNILNFFGKHNEHAGLQGMITVGLSSWKSWQVNEVRDVKSSLFCLFFCSSTASFSRLEQFISGVTHPQSPGLELGRLVSRPSWGTFKVVTVVMYRLSDITNDSYPVEGFAWCVKVFDAS